MKTIFATLIATAALIGVAQAETVTGTLRSFDQVTGTIVLDNGMAYGIDMTDENSEDLIKPIATGSTVTIDVDSGSKLVTDIYASS
jgi:small nuclear ribonucleoprotein (snRNP)-like protein